VDTGFWIALFDKRDAEHNSVGKKEDVIDRYTLIVPWPILYETLRTRFVRRPNWVAQLETRLKRPKVVFVDDRDYCEEALASTVEYSMRLRRPISMVDMLCRLLIADPKIRIDYLLTVNPKDFADLCRKHRVEIV
jgi:predicted nucleic acid-binding protein